MATHAPQQFRFSTREYYRMGESGVLRPDARVELLNGQIFSMSPIGPFHASAVNRLNYIFSNAAAGRWIVSVQNAIALDPYSEPQPDIMLLKPTSDFYREKHPGPDDVFLLIEVSDSSLDFDRDEKLPVYGRAGIREMWIAKIAEETLEVYTQPHFGGYASSEILQPGSQARPTAFPDVAVDVTALLRPTLK